MRNIMLKKGIVSVVLFLFFLSLALPLTSALMSCNTNSISVSYIKGDSVSPYSLSCTNDGNSTVWSDLIGTYVSWNQEDPFASGSGTTKNIQLSFNSNAPQGNYAYKINFDDGSPDVDIALSVLPQADPSDCELITTFPQYSLSIKKDTQPFQNTYSFKVSDTCTGGLDITDILTSGQITFTDNGNAPIRIVGGIPKGTRNPGETFQITLEFDSFDLGLGTYQTSLVVGGTWGSDAVVSQIAYSISVVSSATPIGDVIVVPIFESISSEMNLNQSQTLTVREVNPNLDIIVEPNNYLSGIKTQTIDSTWKWTFVPVRVGNTKVRWWAEYQGGMIGEMQEQDIRIIRSGGAVLGSNLLLIFTPSLSLAKSGEEIIINIATPVIGTNQTNLVDSPELSIDSVPLYASNISGRAFYFTFESGRNYSVRAKAPTYNDLVTTISLTSKPILFTMSPSDGDSDTIFSITGSDEATLCINGNCDMGNPYVGTLEVGNNTFRLFKEGFLDYEQTVSIIEGVTMTRLTEVFKKGDEQIYSLNKNVNWTVSYQKDPDSIPEILIQNNSNEIRFTPDKKGEYKITYGEKFQFETVEGIDWNKQWFGFYWYLWIFALALISYYILSPSSGGKKGKADSVGFGASQSDMGGNVNY